MVAALTVGLIAIVGPAEAATWTSTYNVSATGWMGQDSPTVAVDRQGDALLVWAACDGTKPYCYHQVQARIKPASGSMGAIKTLSPDGAVSAWPQVASDDDGDSAVVWEQEGWIVGRRISATGVVGPLLTLSPGRAMSAAVAVEPTGRALVIWNAVDGGSQTMGRYFGTNGSLGPVLALSGGAMDQPAIAMDRTGTAVAVWTDMFERVVGRRIRPGYVSPLRVIAPPATGVKYARVTVGVDRDGDATIGYRRTRTGEMPRVLAKLWSRTNALSGVLYVSPSTDNVTLYSAVATDLDGDSVLVWSRQTSTTLTEVFGRRISRTGTLGTRTWLGVGDRPAVTVDDDGDGLAVWHSPGPPYEATQVYARTVSPDGVFASREKLSSDGRVVRTDSSPGGRFSLVWQQRSHPYQIQARFGQ
ncbi:MAG TPA: hypothetical protein VHN18_08755 [Micromonosporaceae bacterium]|nr:hypothetical protein [Micromonosporaceae bacterium]